MIAPLRNAHRRVFALLALLVPAVFALGISERRPFAPTPRTAPAGNQLHSRAGHFIVTSLPGNRSVVELTDTMPDPLLYWSSVVPTPALPPAASLIGSAGTDVSELPRSGYLVLYSGGHQQVVDYVGLEERR